MSLTMALSDMRKDLAIMAGGHSDPVMQTGYIRWPEGEALRVICKMRFLSKEQWILNRIGPPPSSDQSANHRSVQARKVGNFSGFELRWFLPDRRTTGQPQPLASLLGEDFGGKVQDEEDGDGAGIDSSKYQVDQSANGEFSLVLHDPVATDSGLYRCVATPEGIGIDLSNIDELAQLSLLDTTSALVSTIKIDVIKRKLC